jgi:hypothetical protein
MLACNIVEEDGAILLQILLQIPSLDSSGPKGHLGSARQPDAIGALQHHNHIFIILSSRRSSGGCGHGRRGGQTTRDKPGTTLSSAAAERPARVRTPGERLQCPAVNAEENVPIEQSSA